SKFSPPAKGEMSQTEGVRVIERLLYRFPEIVERAGKEYAPNYITTYLTELASAFNNFYAQEQIVGNNYRVAITQAFKNVMKNGLDILGIPAPERM
ncbi:MAG: DALR anticodon-binding domain-containing protein, partial [Patescibacteria group bacterium]